jgi:RimJ/RimL family protein N-acetyltransferase
MMERPVGISWIIECTDGSLLRKPRAFNVTRAIPHSITFYLQMSLCIQHVLEPNSMVVLNTTTVPKPCSSIMYDLKAVKLAIICLYPAHDSSANSDPIRSILGIHDVPPLTALRAFVSSTTSQSTMLDYNFHLPTERLIISYLNPSNPLHVSFVYNRYNTRASLDANRRFPNLIHDHDAAKARIEKEGQMMQSKGYGQYLVSISPQQNPSEDLPFSKAIDGHELIGCVSMRHGRLPSAPMYPDVGYAFEEQAQGKGYATEAAKALIK